MRAGAVLRRLAANARPAMWTAQSTTSACTTTTARTGSLTCGRDLAHRESGALFDRLAGPEPAVTFHDAATIEAFDFDDSETETK